ncbi:uncharacterized protein LOC122060935 isoform X3 [Macadamia integrifolia]|uniref:uncharacterized protein LOC122060935 isoform X3 n=1 Tax=Macadamia integrifolia TaxID=60698 RepID=UPI001C52F007|nr:uncharacterized protein LOC122060935 isoform X3 [Macadamia integrifolia]
MSPSATRTGALADFGVSFPFFHPYGLLLVLLLFTGKEGSDASLCNKGSEMMVILSLRIMHCSSIIDERNFYPFLYCLEYMNRLGAASINPSGFALWKAASDREPSFSELTID